MKYYFYMYQGQPVAVYRLYRKDRGWIFERWEGNKWVKSPGLYFVTGATIPTNYVPTTETEALKFLTQYSLV
jgi:hypothetical protein